MRVRIGGKYYELIDCRMTDNGCCDGPHIPGKRIRINKSLKGEARLEILLHEFLHAADWSKDEEWIEETARDFARALTRQGYKRTESD